MRRAGLVVLAGCWTGPGESPRTAPAPKVLVRMAAFSEYQTDDPSKCPVSGATALPYSPPLVGFATDTLVSALDRFGVEPNSPIQTRYIGPDAPKQDPPRGISISIDPRTQVGHMTVANHWADGGDTYEYCVYVEHHGAQTVLVVKSMYSTTDTNTTVH